MNCNQLAFAIKRTSPELVAYKKTSLFNLLMIVEVYILGWAQMSGSSDLDGLIRSLLGLLMHPGPAAG